MDTGENKKHDTQYTESTLDPSSRPTESVLTDDNASLAELVEFLTSHGCSDLTDQLDHSSFSGSPVRGGGYGEVYVGKLRDRRAIGIKVLRAYHGEDQRPDLLQTAARELYVWSQCHHPNVLPLLGFAHFQVQIRMISPWMENGPLPSYLDKHPSIDRFEMSLQICKAVDYLHSVGVIHGGLKGNNVLVSDDGVPVLCDFGDAVLQRDKIWSVAKSLALTQRWAAPELLDYRVEHPDTAADVYSLGMTILEIITGKIPYHYIQNDLVVVTTVVAKKVIPKRPEEFIPPNSEQCDRLWSLLQRCWSYEPQERPGAGEVVSVMSGITRQALLPIPGENNLSTASLARLFVKYGCSVVSTQLDPGSCSIHPISQSKSSKVYRARLHDLTQVAVKLKIRCPDSATDDTPHLQDAARELFIWSNCRHENVLPLLGLAEFRNQLAIVSRWADHGSMPSYISRNPGASRYDLSKGIASGLEYLHRVGVIHGDLKGLNVLVSDEGAPMICGFSNAAELSGGTTIPANTLSKNPASDEAVPMIPGFSNAAQLEKITTPASVSPKKALSPRWQAPELLDESASPCSGPSDVYALGMTILETFTGRVPFFEKSELKVLTAVAIRHMTPVRPEKHISVELDQNDRLWAILTTCWANKPEDRPTAAEIAERLEFASRIVASRARSS